MNVFCMAKRGVNVVYIFINNWWHYFLINDGDDVPTHIKDLENVIIYRSDGEFCNTLAKRGFTKHNIDIGNGFSTYLPSPEKLAVIYNRDVNSESTCQAFAGKLDNQQIPIPVEDVPIGARITGIENDDGEIDEFSFQVQRIEVSDGFITFLHYWPSKQRTYSYEVSIKRGTRVTYTIK